MKRVIVTGLVLYLTLLAGWTRTYGGPGYDEGCDIIQTPEGTYLVVGSTSKTTYEESDLWLLKIDPNGNKIWDKICGIAGRDAGSRIKPAGDGNYLIFGTTDSLAGGGSWVLEVDGSGDTLRTLVLPKQGYTENTSDGGYITAGSENDDVFLCKTDSVGNVQWLQTYPRGGQDYASCVLEASGGYVVAATQGLFQHFYYGSVWCFETDSLGKMRWQYVDSVPYPYTSDGTWAFDMCKSSDGYVITGHYNSDNTMYPSSLFLTRLDISGNLEWEKYYSSSSYGLGIKTTSDGGYIITGDARNLLMLKVDANGDSLWTYFFGDTTDAWGNSVIQTSDGGFIATGFFGYNSDDKKSGDLYLVKTEPDGDTLGISSPPVTRPTSSEIEIVHSFGSEIIMRYFLSPVEPGTLKLFDASGRMVESVAVRGQGEVKVAGLSSGVYFARLEAVGVGVTKKIVLVK